MPKPPDPAFTAVQTEGPRAKHPSAGRPLDAIATGLMIILCLSWGLNQVAVKLTLLDVPPLTLAV